MAEREDITFKRLGDHEWLRQSFMIMHGTQDSSSGDPTNEDVLFRTRFFTAASLKFSDTKLGGNVVINPAPQFTRYADPRIKGLYNGSAGLGRYYSEAIDDNKRLITMSFGVPQFNPISTFYRGFYDHHAATVARTGRAPSAFYTAGRVIGFVAGFLSPWLVLYSIGSAFVKTAMQQPSYKYYFFKPTMASYWNAVSGMANDIAVKTQLVTRMIGDPAGTGGDNQSMLTQSDLNAINKEIPDLVDSYNEGTGEGNGINVYAVATKYTRIQRAAFAALEQSYKSRSAADMFKETANDEVAFITGVISDAVNKAEVQKPKQSFTDYLKNWASGSSPGALGGAGAGLETMSLATGATTEGGATAAPPSQAAQGSTDLLTEKSITSNEAGQEGWYNFLIGELNDGAQHVSFRVENTGDAQESFSNQVGESEISSKINNMSAGKRSTRFSVADGNIGDGPVGTIVEGALGAVKDIVMGAANSLGLDGLAALGGNAFADIPKHYMNSTSSMPRMNYKIKLVSPYGNKYSKFVNIWLPLSMILAAALPLSTGSHSYTSPFICQLFDRGRAQTRLGMIDQISVTRGMSNLAFNKVGEPMSVEVSFSVVEMSNILHMPIAKSFNPLTDAFSAIFDSESLYHDYMATLTSLSFHEQVYVGERLKIGLTKYMKDLDSWFSVPHAMNWAGDLGPMRLFSAFFDGAANR